MEPDADPPALVKPPCQGTRPLGHGTALYVDLPARVKPPSEDTKRLGHGAAPDADSPARVKPPSQDTTPLADPPARVKPASEDTRPPGHGTAPDADPPVGVKAPCQDGMPLADRPASVKPLTQDTRLLPGHNSRRADAEDGGELLGLMMGSSTGPPSNGKELLPRSQEKPSTQARLAASSLLPAGMQRELDRLRADLSSRDPNERAYSAQLLAHAAGPGFVHLTSVPLDIAFLLSDREAFVRKAACNALEELGEFGQPAVPHLLERLEDRETEKSVRQEAILALGSVAKSSKVRESVSKGLSRILKNDDEPLSQAYAAVTAGSIRANLLVGELEHLLELSENPEVKGAAAMSLIGMKEKRPKAVAKLLSSADFEDRITALAAFRDGEMTAEAVPYIPAIARGLREPLLRAAALETLGALGEPAAQHIGQISGFLGSPDAEVRLAAVGALKKLRAFASSESVAVTRGLLSSRAPRFRAAGLSGLGALGEEKSRAHAEAIAEFLTDDSGKSAAPDDRIPNWMQKPNCAAAHALAMMGAAGCKYAASIATYFSAHCSTAMRLAALEALGDMGEQGLAHATVIVDCLKEKEEPRIVISALKQLGKLCGSGIGARVSRHMVQAVNRLDRAYRPVAISAIGAVGAPADVINGLARMLDDALESDDVETAQRVIEALGSIGEPARKHADALRVVLSHQQLQLAAVTSLGAMKASQFAEEVAAILYDSADSQIKSAAIASLGQMGEAGAQHEQKIATFLYDRSWSILRQTACESLGRWAKGGQTLKPETVRLLKDATRDEFEWVRKSATAALGQGR